MHFSAAARRNFYCFWLVDINTGHKPVKLPPGQVPDLRPVSGPPVPSLGCEPFIDHHDPVRLFQDSFDPVTFSAAEQIECISVFFLWKLILNNST